MYFHGLTDKISYTIYVNSEQSSKPYRESSLEQDRIDAAFKRKTRTSKYIFTYKNWEICVLNGINTNNLGVIEKAVLEEGKLSLTNIERTLIDIAVRPVYSGGCRDVLEAYKRAKGKISVDRLYVVKGFGQLSKLQFSDHILV
jgi:predicted transcriptional regulator of viral defense system